MALAVLGVFWSKPDPKTEDEPRADYFNRIPSYQQFRKGKSGAIWLEVSGKCANVGGGHTKILIDVTGESTYPSEGALIPSQFRGLLIHLILKKAPNSESLGATTVAVDYFNDEHPYRMNKSSQFIRIFSRTPGQTTLQTLNADLDNRPRAWTEALVSVAKQVFDSMVDEQQNSPPGELERGYWLPEDEDEETTEEVTMEEILPPHDAAELGNVALTTLEPVWGDDSDTDFYDLAFPLGALPAKDGAPDLDVSTSAPLVDRLLDGGKAFGEVLLEHFGKRFTAAYANRLRPHIVVEEESDAAPSPEGTYWSSFLNCHTFAQRVIEKAFGCKWPEERVPYHERLWMDMAIETMYVQTRMIEVYGRSQSLGKEGSSAAVHAVLDSVSEPLKAIDPFRD